jgi:hypothetical protein
VNITTTLTTTTYYYYYYYYYNTATTTATATTTNTMGQDLTDLIEACLLHVFSYLSLHELSSCLRLNRHFKLLLEIENQFWVDILTRVVNSAVKTVDFPIHLTGNELISDNYRLQPICIVTVEHARTLLSQILLRRHIATQINTDVLEVSSMDREGETPLNTLTKSLCLQSVLRFRNLERNIFERIGYGLQTNYCRCGGSDRSCYWSSAPCPFPTMTEFITFKCGDFEVSLLYGLTLTVYQAFFHPNAPIYAPIQICLQVLAPSHILDFDEFPRNEGSQGTMNYRNRRVDLNRDVAYQSPFFTIQQSSETQIFMLPSPVVCCGGRVRVVMKGAQERQSLAEWGVQHADDYYICLSNVEVLGTYFPDYVVRRTTCNPNCIELAKLDL